MTEILKLDAPNNGKTYSFVPYRKEAPWNDVPGLYAFASANALFTTIYYIGRADSFRSRIPNHERWAEAQRLGAQIVFACVITDESERHAVEKGLIGRHNPPLNDQHRTEQKRSENMTFGTLADLAYGTPSPRTDTSGTLADVAFRTPPSKNLTFGSLADVAFGVSSNQLLGSVSQQPKTGNPLAGLEHLDRLKSPHVRLAAIYGLSDLK